VVFLSGSESDFLLFLLHIKLFRRKIEIASNGLTTQHCCDFSKPEHEFPSAYVVLVFVFNDLRRELVVPFLDIG
jgi:hypothetical protein